MRKASRVIRKNDNRVHIQAWLHKLYIRESDAIKAYELATKKDGLSERDAVREAFIAYGMMRDKNWRPQALPTQVAITDEMYKMFQGLQGLFQKLSEVDFSTAKTHTGDNVDVEAVQRDLSSFERNSMGMLGTVYKFEDED